MARTKTTDVSQETGEHLDAIWSVLVTHAGAKECWRSYFLAACADGHDIAYHFGGDLDATVLLRSGKPAQVSITDPERVTPTRARRVRAVNKALEALA